MEKWNSDYEKWMADAGISVEDKEEMKKFTPDEVKNNFYQDLEFGTAGIRGVRGLGTNRINKYIIRKVTEGYCTFLLGNVRDAAARGVAIAYDSRHMSKEFAFEAAMVFSASGIKVYMYDRIRSTPELSFTIRHLGAAGGLVLTASHNPPEYNGYKAYNEYGIQLSTDETSALASNIAAISSFAEVKIDESLKTLTYLGDEVEDVYIDKILKLSLSPFNKDLKIVYSPLFGVGLKPVQRLLDQVGANYHLVKEQSVPDGDFPTAKKPNPEEKEALARIIEEGRLVGGELLLATDPDADRLGVMALHQGDYVYLTGNQIGALLIDYILARSKVAPGRSYVLTSIVTSTFGAEVARTYGADTIVTFTGFKNLGKKMEDLLGQGDKVFFVYEESIGYLCEDFIRDKDGISAAFLIAEMAGVYKKQGMTLVDKLRELYGKVGYFKESQISFVIPGIEGIGKIAGIMQDLRDNGSGEFKAPLEIAEEIDYKTVMMDGETTNLLYYKFKDGSWVGVRPSGTEPKLKLYINAVDRDEKTAELKVSLIEDWFRNRTASWF